MARAPSFKTSSLADLHRQLRYAPPDTLERQMEAAESLADEIDPERAYPEEFIVFRITQYRPRVHDEPVMLVGTAVLADLATLVQSLSASLALQPMDARRGRATAVADLAGELGIAERTLRRYHKRGLLLHYVQFEKDDRRLACYERSLVNFRKREPALLERAGSYSRLTPEDEAALIAEAIGLHESERLSRKEISRVLGARHGRAVETVRSLLSRLEKEKGARLFKGTRKVSPRDEAFAIRAWARAVPIPQIAQRLGRSAMTVRRTVGGHRAQRLGALSLSWIDLPTFSLPDADAVILAAPAAQKGLLQAPTGGQDALDLLEDLRRIARDDPGGKAAALEGARLAAFNLLKRRAAAEIASLRALPSDDDFDAIERDLRWAALLKRTLVFRALPAAIVRIEQNLARPLHQQTSEAIRKLFRIAVHETSEAVESADPSREQKATSMPGALTFSPIERIAGLSIDKELARQGIGRGGTAAGVRHAAGSVPLGDPFSTLCAWQHWSDLPLRFAIRVGQLEAPTQALIAEHYGLRGSRPATPREISAKHGLSLRAVSSRLSSGLRALRRDVPLSPRDGGRE